MIASTEVPYARPCRRPSRYQGSQQEPRPCSPRLQPTCDRDGNRTVGHWSAGDLQDTSGVVYLLFNLYIYYIICIFIIYLYIYYISSCIFIIIKRILKIERESVEEFNQWEQLKWCGLNWYFILIFHIVINEKKFENSQIFNHWA